MSIHQLVETQAGETPDAVAVAGAGRSGGETLTYGGLDRRADRLARRLLALGVGRETLVAVAPDRSPAVAVALLAVLKAGGAYLPLEADDPAPLLAAKLANARPRLLLTTAELSLRWPDFGLPVLCVDAPAGAASAGRVHGRALPENPAYVLHTSGSTGLPKAVAVSHGALRNHQTWMRKAFELSRGDRVLQKARLDFDASVWEIWAPLVAGARLVLAPAGARRDPAGLVAAVDRHRITTLHVVPSLLGLLLDQPGFAACASLRRVCSGGEALGRELGERFFASGPRCALFNLYGPAEVTIQASYAKYSDAGSLPGAICSTLPIGGPIAGARLRLLDADLAPAVEGGLYVGGAGLARGYLRSPAATARRFLPDPFAEEPGARLYDTGDLARRLPGGSLEFRGRVDHQLEVRGFRVEPGEIAAALAEHPAVREVLVVARDGLSGPVVGAGDRPRDARLVAYVVARAASSEASGAAPERQAEHVAHWRSIFEQAYGQGAAAVDPAADFASWDSSYTGRPLPAEEMHDAVEQTVARILGLSPRRVLEVGCGTGLLAFRVAPHCASYLGTDFSASVIETVRRRRPSSLPQLTVRTQAAHDFAGIEAASFDTVVCNSVIGHFPSMDYLVEVLERMVEATALGGSIFIGDVRNRPLLDALMGSIELFKAPADLPLDELRRRLRRGVSRHDRLVVDPAFFVALKRRLPRLREVRILPKTGRYVTELTRFRYDALLHLDRSAPGLPPLAPPGELAPEWLDWRGEGLGRAAFLRLLERRRPPALGLAGVPSARLRREVGLVEALARPDALATVGELREALASLPEEGLDPGDLAALLEGTGYAHELSWARCDARGRFDVVLWRSENGRAARRPRPPEPAAAQLGRPWSAFGTDPLRGPLGERLIPRWRRHLEIRLPEHMRPSAYVLLDALPRNANGKLDRGALPPPGTARPELDTVFKAPRDDTEERLAAIWREVLGVDEVGVHDSFFELGGHSLLATQVASRVRRLFQVPLPLRSLLDAPTVAELAGRLARERAAPAALPAPPPIARARRRPRLPLSFAQQRLWFFDRLAPGNVVYNESALFDLRGPLDAAALDSALRSLVRRHEILRTTFDSADGEPFQVIHDAAEPDFQVVDLSRIGGRPARLAACDAAVSRTVARPFHLGRGPLLRLRLLRLAEREHRLLFALHHVISDGWSRRVLFRELGVLYRGFAGGRPAALPALAIQYADYAVWQRDWLRGEVLERYLDLWRRKLGTDLPQLCLPYDRPAPGRPGWRGATRPVRLGPAVFQALSTTCREHRATPFMGLVAALEALLLPFSEGRPVVVGTVIAGRNHEALEDLLGMFVNVLPLHTDAGGDPSFGELLDRVRESVAFSDAVQDLPFDKLVEELQPRRGVGETPLFQVLFNYQSEPPDELELAGAAAAVVPVAETTSKFELTLALDELESGLAGQWIYRTERFDAATVEALAVRFDALVSSAAGNPGQALSRLAAASETERRAVLEGPRPEPPPGNGRVDERIREWSRRRPEALAVVAEGRGLSYGELARRAGGLARELRRLGVGPEVPVVLALERSGELMIAVLAVLEAGGFWAALDLAHPRRGQARLLAELKAPVIVSDRARAAGLPAHGARVVLVDGRRWTGGGAPGAARGAGPENLAYAVFTSGSTGRPKAVGVEHRQLLAYAAGIRGRLDLGPGAGWASVSTFAADLGHTAVFGALCSGGCLHLIGRERAMDPRAMADHFAGERIDCLKIVPSHLRALEGAGGAPAVAPRRWLIVGGEAAPREWIDDLRGRLGACRVLNHYGPTETTVGVLAREVEGATGGTGTLPLGRPLPGVRIHLLTASFEPASVWRPGEIAIGGATVGRGYLGRPARTAGSFVPDPFRRRPGGRLYKSGDRARLLPGGDVEFLGRLDDQVKLHGFRVELGAIRRLLAAHAAVRDGAVRLLDDGRGGSVLVAYYVSGKVLEPAELRRWLARELPEAILPHHFVHLDALPLTPNGKLDVEALPGLGQVRSASRRGFAAPRTAAEAAVATVWAETLGLDRVGAGDDFFELGGHSLLAARVASRLGRACGAEVPLRLLFEFPVLADLASALDEKQGGKSYGTSIASIKSMSSIPRARRQLSFAQQRLWFLDQLDGGRGGTYNVPATFHLGGELAPASLFAALAAIVRRHEVLRTSFPSRDGRPSLHVHRDSVLDAAVVDLSGLPGGHGRREVLRRARGEAATPFDLDRGPLFRVRLFRLGLREHVLVVALHHIVADGESRGVLYRELSTFYAAAAEGRTAVLPGLEVQYADFAAWQRERLSGEELERHLEYWRRRLARVPALRLPADRPRGAAPPARGARLHRRLDASLTSALRALGRGAGASLYMTLLAAFTVLASRLAAQRDFAVGSPFSHREPWTEGLIGCFVNLVALRPGPASGAFSEHLRRLRDTVLEAFAHQDLAFEKLVEELAPERDLSRHPLFQVTLDLREATAELALAGLAVRPLELGAAPVELDLELHVRAGGPDGGLSCRFSYPTDLFEPTTIGRWAGHFETLLREVVAAPERPPDALAIHSPAQRHQAVAEWNDTAAPAPAGEALHELFASQAARTPDRAALVWQKGESGAVLSYALTARRARRLAAVLRGLGAGTDDRVAIVLERGPELVVAMLGILGAGAAYLPLDPDHPRLAEIVAGARAAAVVSAPRLAARLAGLAVPIVALAPGGEPPGRPWPESSRPPAGGARAAYVLYTSGSTGRPKGVVISHAPIVSHMRWMQSALPLGPDDRVLQKTPATFDASLWEFWAPLQIGAPVVLAPPGSHRDPTELLSVVRRQRASVLQVVPSLLEVLLDEPELAHCTSLRRVVCGGEPLMPAVAERFFSIGLAARLYNVYGPTEATIHASFERCLPVTGSRMTGSLMAGSRVTLGRPIQNVRVHVLDRALRPSTIGAPGELHVAGASLARGYLDQPRKSAESFVPDPFAEAGARLYRTGDRARQLPDGRLELLGRRDHQVKLRGVRVELGEIEAALAAHRAVRRAVVVLAGRGVAGHGQPTLVAFLEVAGRCPAAAELRRFLAERLPAALLPDAWVVRARLPSTASGKIDRRALESEAEDPPRRGSRKDFSPPRSPVEETLAAIWAEVLGIDRVGVDDHFFDLGGHSLLATRVVSRARRILTVETSLRDLFDRPVLSRWAAHVDRALRGGAALDESPIGRVPRRRPPPLSFAQQRLFFLDELVPGGTAYNMPAAWRLRGRLDATALAASCRELVRRHEVLRTRFPKIDGRPVQAISAEPRLTWTGVDLEALPTGDREREAARILDRASRAPFDLARGPLVRVLLARLGPRTHVLLVTLHHIVADGWSLGIVSRELRVAYAAFRARRPSPLPAPAIQYADFAVWQRRRLRGERLAAELAYWQRQLAGLPALELPLDRPRPAAPLGRRAVLAVELDAALTGDLRALSSSAGTSLYMTLLAAFLALLARHSGQRDLAVGSPIANRNREEIEDLVGFFVNLLVLRGDLRESADRGFRDFLEQVRETALGAYAHQDLPFERLARELRPERELSRHPLVQATFALQNVPERRLELAGLAVTPVPCGTDAARCDLELSFFEEADALDGSLIYAAELFDATTMVRLAASFERFLRSVATDRCDRLEEISTSTPGERHQTLAEWNDTRALRPSGELLHHLFEARAAAVPDRSALAWRRADGRDAVWTFERLERLSNHLAGALAARGVSADQRVAIFLERGPEQVLAMLGVVKAGGAFLPLDPDYPMRRLAFLIADSGAVSILTTEELASRLPRPSAPVFLLGPAALAGAAPAPRPAASDNLAYVLYTSGSTGRPKGVAITHAAIVRHMRWIETAFAVGEDDCILQRASASYDASVWEIWAPLRIGAKLVLLRPGGHRDVDHLVEESRRRDVTILPVVPTLLRELLLQPGLERCHVLRQVVCGGEPLAPELAAGLLERLPGIALANCYGPTEATIDASWASFRGRAGRVTIGRPIANARLLVLDRLRRVPLGAPGELHVGGAGLARAYLGRPGLTAEKLVPDPFSTRRGERLFKTGDRARQLADGRLDCLGRLDHQVKVRGIRVELGEIEAALRGHEKVREAVVTAAPETAAPDGSAVRLVAHVVVESAAWRASLAVQAERVERWRIVYEDLHGDRTGNGEDADFVGWNESVTGKPFPREEMEEWIERSVAWVLGRKPRRVLELGCGTGLLLRRIAPFCERYVGTDFSRRALEALRPRIRLPHVELVLASAHELGQLGAGVFDTVVLNSVVQYFPGVDYLLKVLRGAVEAAAPGGSILVGDVRDLSLLDDFYAWLETSRGTCPPGELRRRLGERRRRERELVIDPAFFQALQRELPRVTGVAIERRQGRFSNELTKFRYDVVLELDRPYGEAALESGAAHRPLEELVSHPLRAEIEARLKERWRSYLLERLPGYMVPSVFNVLDALPLTAGGKVDRRALPAPDGSRPDHGTGLVEPRSPMEARLAELWSELLGIREIGARDDFFALGGHSLQSVRLAARLSTALGTPVGVRLLFRHPILADLAAALATLSEGRAPVAPSGESAAGRPEVETRDAGPRPVSKESTLSRLVLSGEVEPVDAAAIGVLSARLLACLELERRDEAKAAIDGEPYVSEIAQTPWGRIAVVVLPLFGVELYDDREALLEELVGALELSSSLGARSVSLTGLIPSATAYGRAVLEAVGPRTDLPAVTTGHATTCAAVGLNVGRLLAESGRDLSRERIGFLGLGSIGTAALRLLLDRMPHPEEILLCDVAGRREALEELGVEIRGYGFRGRIRLAEARHELPAAIYEASLVVGATNVSDVLDVERLRPGTLVVDDSGPHCFDLGAAERRLAHRGDILFTEGGVLESPRPITRLRHTPPRLRALDTGEPALSPAWWRDAMASRITGCVLSSLLSAVEPGLSPAVGLVETPVASEHLDALLELGFRGAPLHCSGRPLPAAAVRRFRERFGER